MAEKVAAQKHVFKSNCAILRKIMRKRPDIADIDPEDIEDILHTPFAEKGVDVSVGAIPFIPQVEFDRHDARNHAAEQAALITSIVIGLNDQEVKLRYMAGRVPKHAIEARDRRKFLAKTLAPQIGKKVS